MLDICQRLSLSYLNTDEASFNIELSGIRFRLFLKVIGQLDYVGVWAELGQVHPELPQHILKNLLEINQQLFSLGHMSYAIDSETQELLLMFLSPSSVANGQDIAEFIQTTSHLKQDVFQHVSEHL